MRTHAKNFVRLPTTEETGGTSLTFSFADTAAGPAVPCYAVVNLGDETRREVALLSTKTATTYQCASLDDRYLEGSADGSGITHPEDSPVLFAPVSQNLEDLWDAIEGIDPDVPGGKNSIELDDGDFQLVGDADDPGPDKVYGTDDAGVKGFHDRASGPGLMGVEIFTSSGTFTKASHPGLERVRVRVLAGGGSGSSTTNTSAGQVSVGGGGAAGGYAEKWIDAATLSAEETVTVGMGGAQKAAGTGGGASGGNSAFGTHATANGGEGGGHHAAATPPHITTTAKGGTATAAGGLAVKGSGGSPAIAINAESGRQTGGGGGPSAFGGGGAAGRVDQAAEAGGPGAGGGGGANGGGQPGQIGAAGGNGIVIVELYGSPE